MISTPNQIEKYGPWFISKLFMTKIDILFEELYKDIIEYRYNELLEHAEKEKQYSYNKDKTIEELRDAIFAREKAGYYKRVELGLSGDAEIITDSIRDAISNLTMKNRRSCYITYKIKIEMKEFELDIASRFGKSLKYHTSYINEDLKSKLFFKFEECIDDFKVKPAVQVWSRYHIALCWIPNTIFWIIFFIRQFNNNSFYKNAIKDEMRKQLQNTSFNQDQINSFIISIAKLASDFKPNTPINFGNTLGYNFYILLPLLGLILLNAPRTAIEYGKSEKTIIIWKSWTYIVLVLIPLSIIVPIFINLITK